MDIPPAVGDFSKRRLCPDGACTGIVGPDGYCTECGKFVGPAEGDDQDSEAAAASESDGEGTPEKQGVEEQGLAPGLVLPGRSASNGESSAGAGTTREDETDAENEADKGDDDFSKRRLCPDGACTGIIGPDGRCTECGRRVDD